MTETEEKKRLITAANKYSDIAVNESMSKAARQYWSDYRDGSWTFPEHLILPSLIQLYANCKNGQITRAECITGQKKILNKLGEPQYDLTA